MSTNQLNNGVSEGNKSFEDGFFYEDLSYQKNPLKKFYLRKNSRLDYSEEELDYSVSPFSIIFMTTPDCTNIFGSKTYENNLIMADNELSSIDIDIRKMLCFTENNMPFIPIVTNFFDIDSFDLNEISLDTFDNGENRYGVKQSIPKNYLQSQTTPNLGITYNEISSFNSNSKEYYGINIITKLHKAWVRYIHDIRLGKIYPGTPYSMDLGKKFRSSTDRKLFNIKSVSTNTGYFKNSDTKKNLNDMSNSRNIDLNLKKVSELRALQLATLVRKINFVSSIYFFKLLPDGKTISYYCKYSGVYPKNYGNNSFSASNKEVTKINIDYQAQFFEDLKIDIIRSFNYTSLRKSKLDDSLKSIIPEQTFLEKIKETDLIYPFVYLGKDKTLKLYINQKFSKEKQK